MFAYSGDLTTLHRASFGQSWRQFLGSVIAVGLILISSAAMAQTASTAQAGVAAAVRGEVRLIALSAQPPAGAAAVGRVIASGDRIFLGDQIETGPRAGLQIMLLDETIFTIGPNAAMVIDKFVYDPATNAGELTASIVKGAFRFVSGRIAKNNPSDMNVKLPVATIGIRGTAVAGEVVPATLNSPPSAEVILLGPGARNNADERAGRVIVGNAGSSVEISRPGFGTTIAGTQAPPTPPVRVPPGRIASLGGNLAGTGSAGDDSGGTDNNADGQNGDGQSDDTQSGDDQSSGGNTDSSNGGNTEDNGVGTSSAGNDGETDSNGGGSNENGESGGQTGTQQANSGSDGSGSDGSGGNSSGSGENQSSPPALGTSAGGAAPADAAQGSGSTEGPGPTGVGTVSGPGGGGSTFAASGAGGGGTNNPPGSGGFAPASTGPAVTPAPITVPQLATFSGLNLGNSIETVRTVPQEQDANQANDDQTSEAAQNAAARLSQVTTFQQLVKGNLTGTGTFVMNNVPLTLQSSPLNPNTGNPLTGSGKYDARVDANFTNRTIELVVQNVTYDYQTVVFGTVIPQINNNFTFNSNAQNNNGVFDDNNYANQVGNVEGVWNSNNEKVNFQVVPFEPFSGTAHEAEVSARLTNATETGNIAAAARVAVKVTITHSANLGKTVIAGSGTAPRN